MDCNQLVFDQPFLCDALFCAFDRLCWCCGISKGLQSACGAHRLLAMLIVVLLGTFFQHSIYVLVLQITGAPISWLESLDRVILPSALLNLIFSLPIYAIAKDLAGRISPQEVEV
jgi:hypothetical protein